MNNQLERLQQINEGIEGKSFLDQELHIQATKDFKYLALQTGYNLFVNLNCQRLTTADKDSRYVGDYLVLGYNMQDKRVLFPKGLINVENPDMNVAVVCYKDGDVQDVLVFGATNFKKIGMFSIFKDVKASGAYAINIGDLGKLKQYSFGYVIKNK